MCILVCPTYNRFADCVTMIQSAYSGTVQPTHTIIYDNSVGGFIQYLRQNTIELPAEIQIIIPPSNFGCARSWNHMIKTAYGRSQEEHVLVSNDDITFENKTVALFEQAILDNPNEVVYVCGGIDSPNAFSLYATRLDKLESTVGLFDEFFLYPYCEDGDMARRLMLAGLKLFRVEGASADHIGSATIKAYDYDETMKHHVRFSRNAEYFNMKWGLTDHNYWMSQEGFIKPFDGDIQYKEIVLSTIKNMYGE